MDKKDMKGLIDEFAEVSLTFRLPRILRDDFRRVAGADGRSVSEELRRLMEKRVSDDTELSARVEKLEKVIGKIIAGMDDGK